MYLCLLEKCIESESVNGKGERILFSDVALEPIQKFLVTEYPNNLDKSLLIVKFLQIAQKFLSKLLEVKRGEGISKEDKLFELIRKDLEKNRSLKINCLSLLLEICGIKNLNKFSKISEQLLTRLHSIPNLHEKPADAMITLHALKTVVHRMELSSQGASEYIVYLLEYYSSNQWAESKTASWIFPHLSVNQDTNENVIKLFYDALNKNQ